MGWAIVRHMFRWEEMTCGDVDEDEDEDIHIYINRHRIDI